MKEFFKKHWVLVGLGFLAMVLLGLKLIPLSPVEKSNLGGQVSPMPTGVAAIAWRGIKPGETSLTEVKDKLGAPEKEIQEKGKTTLEYTSQIPLFPNVVLGEKDKVELIRERYASSQGKNLFAKLKAEYGEPDARLYGSRSTVGFDLYVFLKSGVASLANAEQGQVLEVWYFTPGMSLAEFMSKWATDYTREAKYQF